MPWVAWLHAAWTNRDERDEEPLFNIFWPSPPANDDDGAAADDDEPWPSKGRRRADQPMASQSQSCQPSKRR